MITNLIDKAFCQGTLTLIRRRLLIEVVERDYDQTMVAVVVFFGGWNMRRMRCVLSGDEGRVDP